MCDTFTIVLLYLYILAIIILIIHPSALGQCMVLSGVSGAGCKEYPVPDL